MSDPVYTDMKSSALFSTRASKASGLALVLAYVLFLLIQHWQIFPYHDDWGYAVLSYVTEQQGFTGQNFTLQQLLAFLADEYRSWTGRVVAFFIQISLFKAGLDVVRVVQVGVMLSITLLSLKIIDRGPILRASLALPMLCFIALPSFVTVGGLYWFSASIAYVWGVLPLFWGAWRLQVTGRLDMGSALLIALAALFQEQMAVATLAFLATLVVIERCRKSEVSLGHSLLHAVPALMATVVVVLSPGNFARNAATERSGSIVAVIGDNFLSLGHDLAGTSESYAFLVLMLLSLAALLPAGVKYWLPRSSVPVLTVTILSVIAILCALLPVAGVVMLLALWVILLIWRAIHDNIPMVVACFAMAALGSLVLLLISPGISGRSLLPFYFLMFVPVTYSLKHLFDTAVGHWGAATAAVLALLVVLWSGGAQTLMVYQGYAHNQPVYQENLKRLRAMEKLAPSLQEIGLTPAIILKRLPNDRYAETMPYQRPLVGRWMKKFYSLPASAVFIWIGP